MAVAFLDFGTTPSAELEAKIRGTAARLTSESEVNIKDGMRSPGCRPSPRQLTHNIFANLTPRWQITQLARHPQRPYPLDYTGMILTEFHELARAIACTPMTWPSSSAAWGGSRTSAWS